MGEIAEDIKGQLLKTLGDLPPKEIRELLDFATFLRERVNRRGTSAPPFGVKTLPASTLLLLTGAVSLGGDELRDTEAVYDAESTGDH